MQRHLVFFLLALVAFAAAVPSPAARDEADDLLGAEDRSREELENPTDDKAVANPDDASSEEEPKKPPSPADADDDDDDDDDDDEDAVSAVFQSFPNIFKILRMPSNRPWWDGPNVCVERDVKESNETESESSGNNFFIFGTAQFSSCKHSPNKYQCTTITSENGKTKTSTVTYQCCHGFRRSPKTPGCNKIDTKPLIELAEESGCGEFAAALRAAAVEELSRGNVTIFAVTDEAMAAASQGDGSLKGSLMTNEVTDEKSADSGNNQVVLNHIVTGLVETDDFYNDLVLHSRLDNGTLRVNVFPGRRGTTLTVNCAKLNNTDKISTEGVLHTVSAVLRPVTQSISQLLSQPKYSQFKQLLEQNDLMEKLEGNGPVTVLALTNDQMAKAEVPKMCLKRVLEHHILPHTVCAEAASQGKVAALDLASDWVRLERDDNGNLIFDNGVRATTPDIIATNGVIHEVENYAIPQAAKTSTELLRATNHTKFLALIERAGLMKVLDEAKDVTIFVPSESGITSHEDELMEMDDAKLKETLMYHIISDPISSGKLRDNSALVTMSEGRTLPISLVSNVLAGLAGLGTRALIGCSPITRVDGDVCNGVVHEIAAPVFPSHKSVFELLQADDDLKQFRKVMEGTKLEEELKKGSLGDVTVLTPTDEAFSALGNDNLEILLKDKDLADQILRNHVLKGRVCCGSVGVSAWPFVSSEASIGGMPVETNRIRSRVTFAGVGASKCDTSATDGLIHRLDGVIFPMRGLLSASGLRRNTDIVYHRPNSDIVLTGF